MGNLYDQIRRPLRHLEVWRCGQYLLASAAMSRSRLAAAVSDLITRLSVERWLLDHSR
jgi:hypothetical protein